MKNSNEKIAVIGLGYVGLPVAVALARKFSGVVGFDISARRIAALRVHNDWTNEITSAELAKSTLKLTDTAANLSGCNFFVVTVPTPIDQQRRPDLAPLKEACAFIGSILKPGAIVVFESTVYPGVTENVCGPLLEKHSGLKRGVDFKLGYSPEQINPGDKQHRLETITKIIAAEDVESLARVKAVYGAIITAGLYEAQSIKVAEAAKVLARSIHRPDVIRMRSMTSRRSAQFFAARRGVGVFF